MQYIKSIRLRSKLVIIRTILNELHNYSIHELFSDTNVCTAISYLTFVID